MLLYFSAVQPIIIFFFFFNDTATTEIYTLSLHDALPISRCDRRMPGTFSSSAAGSPASRSRSASTKPASPAECSRPRDRKSTRLNSSHLVISYAVFCLKKKKNRSSQKLGHTPDKCYRGLT